MPESQLICRITLTEFKQMANRVMRLKNNPKARGFIVYVLEQKAGPTLDGSLQFVTIESVTAGTKKKADALYAELKAKHDIA